MTLLASKTNPTLYTAILGDGDGKADAIVKVGSADRFVPNVNASKWSDEAWINLNYRAMTVLSEKEAVSDDRVSLKVGGVTWKSWTLGTGVLECALIFDSKADLPADGQIRLEVKDSGNLSYRYQPALTQWEIDDGCVRPDNVVGSYAVYFSMANNQYKTGKFCHLFRWEAIGSDGKKQWCEPLKIDGGDLVIGIPDASGMAFPVTFMGAGDTLGYSSVGASTGGGSDSIVYYVKDSTVGAGNVQTFHAAIGAVSATPKIKLGLYTDNAGVPDSLVEQVEINPVSVSDDNSKAGAGSALLATTPYWVAIITDDTSTDFKYDAYSADDERRKSTTAYADEMLAAAGTTSDWSVTPSIWIDYGAAGTPVKPKRRTIINIDISSLLPAWFLAACVVNRPMNRRDWLRPWKWLTPSTWAGKKEN